MPPIASPQNTSTVFFYVGVNLSSIRGLPSYQIYFLGTCEQGPEWDVRNAEEMVMNDISGTRLPFDVLDQGSDALIRTPMTYWREDTVERIECVRNIATVTLGRESSADRGALLRAEGLLWPLYALFGNRNGPVMQAAGMPAGRRFYYARPESIISQTGRRVNRKQIIWHCYSFWDPPSGEHRLFDIDVSAAVPVLPI